MIHELDLLNLTVLNVYRTIERTEYKNQRKEKKSDGNERSIEWKVDKKSKRTSNCNISPIGLVFPIDLRSINCFVGWGASVDL